MTRTLFISFILFGLLVFCGEAMGQNLVPNPSFEEYTECPYSAGQVSLANGWLSIRGSNDYFNSCGTAAFGTPNNRAGFQDALSGNAYIGLIPWSLPFHNSREFAGVWFTNPLDINTKYNVKMYLSMADTVQYAIRNFGALFTSEQPSNDINDLLNLNPQVVYTDSAFLDSQDGWMLFEGSFIAQGGEQFLTIGNFDDDSETDTLTVINQPAVQAYYFIDDVSVVKDTSYHVGVEELENEERGLEIYPNPSNGNLNFDLRIPERALAELEIWNVSGQQVHHSVLSNGQNVLNMHVAKGLYIYSVSVNGETKWSGKVSISTNTP